MRLKTATTLSSLTSSIEVPQQKPNQQHTTLYKFSEFYDSQSPIKLCKNYLDSFKQPLQDRIQYVRSSISSKSVAIQRTQSEHQKQYRNYERMINYSLKKHSISTVSKKLSRKSKEEKDRSKITDLKGIVSCKMMKQLASENNFSQNEEIIQNILKNNKQRQELFEQSILVDRMLSIRRQMRITKDSNRITPIQYEPKHFHLNEVHRDVSTFYRRKFVKKSVTFNFQSKVNELQITKLRNQYEENQVLMKNLMQNYSVQIAAEKDANSMLINDSIKKLFLHYSNRTGSIEQSYQFISKAKLNQFLEDFQFSQSRKSINQQALSQKQFNIIAFTEIIFNLSSEKFKFIQNGVTQFLKACIISKERIYVPKQCLLYASKRQMIQKYFKIHKILQLLQIICASLSRVGVADGKGQIWLSFDNLYELMLNLKLYPSHISKLKMKYYYLYCESGNQAIRLECVMDILAYISLLNQQKFQKTFFQIIHLIRTFS